MQLSRAMILDVEDLEKVLVSCPEWGGDVYVRVLTARERETYEQVIDVRRLAAEANAPAEDGTLSESDTLSEADTLPPSLRIPLIRMATCNGDGDALFHRQDDEWLSGKSQVVTTRIFDAAWKLNKLGREDAEEVKKNSDGAQAADSSSSLPLA